VTTQAKNYGLIFYNNELRYFTDYEVVKEKHSEHIKATLVSGRIVRVHPYYSKKLDRVVEARECIYRQPKALTLH